MFPQTFCMECMVAIKYLCYQRTSQTATQKQNIGTRHRQDTMIEFCGGPCKPDLLPGACCEGLEGEVELWLKGLVHSPHVREEGE